MKKLILLFTLIFSGFVFGQYVPEHGIPSPHPPEINSVKNEDHKIFDKVDKTPVFSSANYNSFEELFTLQLAVEKNNLSNLTVSRLQPKERKTLYS